MEKIKLVIWDLDETFWKGTLSEEGVQKIQSNIDLVIELTRRGIMNSICSKNDFETAQTKLIEFGVWDYFVFPLIEWSPKGKAVTKIISEFQFRPINVLFLDDNHSNLEEVTFYNPSVNTKSQYFIPEILEHPAFKGKDDNNIERLSDYKLLEEKSKIKVDFGSNEEFLNQSEIKIKIHDKGLENYFDRIFELIERTNQLNYTKKRIVKEELHSLVRDQNKNNFIISVSDKYGDYGTVGFVSLDKKENKLNHFVFSCRVLNLGIDQFIYAYLKFPEIEIVGEVSGILEKGKTLNYITIVSEAESPITKTEKSKLSIFYRGGCDLSQMFISLKEWDVNLIEESNYRGESGFPIHIEHTINIVNGIQLDNEIIVNLESTIPFIGKGFYNSEIFTKKYDVIVLSVLMDYTQRVFFNKLNPSIKLTYGSFHKDDFTNVDDFDNLLIWGERKKVQSLDLNFLNNFSNAYRSNGPISGQEMINNLELIFEKLQGNPIIILVNGAEIDVIPENSAEKSVFIERHKEMNAYLDKFIETLPNVFLLDVRKFIDSPDKLTDSIRHYKPAIYRQLAEELRNIIFMKFGDMVAQNRKFPLLRKIGSFVKSKMIS
jgi:FkbH-like protein